jgi:hypothetical protein
MEIMIVESKRLKQSRFESFSFFKTPLGDWQEFNALARRGNAGLSMPTLPSDYRPSAESPSRSKSLK